MELKVDLLYKFVKCHSHAFNRISREWLCWIKAVRVGCEQPLIRDALRCWISYPLICTCWIEFLLFVREAGRDRAIASIARISILKPNLAGTAAVPHLIRKYAAAVTIHQGSGEKPRNCDIGVVGRYNLRQHPSKNS